MRSAETVHGRGILTVAATVLVTVLWRVRLSTVSGTPLWWLSGLALGGGASQRVRL